MSCLVCFANGFATGASNFISISIYLKKKKKKRKQRVQAGWSGRRNVLGVICDKRVAAKVKKKGLQEKK